MASRDGRLRILKSDGIIAAADCRLDQRPRWLAFDASGKRLAVICADRLYRMSIDGGMNEIYEEIIHPNRIALVAVSKDGSIVMVDSRQGISRIASDQFATGTTLCAHLPEQPEAMWPNRDGRRCAVATRGHDVCVWGIVDGNVLSPVMSHDSQVQCAAFSDSDTLLATITGDQTIRIWHVRNGARV